MSVLIDSYGWIEYFSNGPLADKYSRHIEAVSKNSCFIPSIVLYEVYRRIKKIKKEPEALLAYAYIIAHTNIVPAGKKIALDAAEISLEHGLGMADSIIMATARRFDAKIVTSDKHFMGKENVVFIS